MTDVDTLQALRDKVADANVSNDDAGRLAIAFFERRAPDPIQGRTDREAGGDFPFSIDRHKNPGLSMDAALLLATQVCRREWPDCLRKALSTQSELHHWHINFPREGQMEQMPRAVLLATLDRIIANPHDGDPVT